MNEIIKFDLVQEIWMTHKPYCAKQEGLHFNRMSIIRGDSPDLI